MNRLAAILAAVFCAAGLYLFVTVEGSAASLGAFAAACVVAFLGGLVGSRT